MSNLLPKLQTPIAKNNHLGKQHKNEPRYNNIQIHTFKSHEKS